jgi:UDP-N-acetylglucosamine 2-epimerase
MLLGRGARPQLIKPAALSRELRRSDRELLLHTGQHYDYAICGIFFDGWKCLRPT